MTTVEIIAVGNELLGGDVQDTNAHWLCQQITGLGGWVGRVVMIRDDAEVIATVLREALARRPRLVFTAGGMGPTADDMTLAAVAQATNRPLGLSDEALAMVRRAYEKFASEGFVDSAEMTESRRKMAMLPAGAEPLDNPVGAAPGVLLQVDDQTIVSLPGVPEELKGVFTSALRPVLQDVLGSSAFAERGFHASCGDESVLAPLLAEVAERHPQAHIKSRPQRFARNLKMRILISARGPSRQSALRALEQAAADARQTLESRGIELTVDR